MAVPALPHTLLALAAVCWSSAAGGAAPPQAQAPPSGLRPPRWRRVPTGTVRPRGWLLTQARLQADALTSHLPLIWPEVANTSWLGGPDDNVGGLHESTPYWLNGATPLAFQLGDKALLDTVRQYIDGILARQAADGWLGPDTDHGDFWSRYPFILALAQYHEALPGKSAERQHALDGATRFLAAMAARLEGGTPLTSWSSSRAHDLIWAIHYFVDVLGEGPEADKLLRLAARLHKDGIDWHSQWFNSSDFPKEAVKGDFGGQMTHGVNNAQAIKRGSVWARQGGNATQGTAESWFAWKVLMRYHGQPNGVFSADEHLAGLLPSRGTELCVVVEAMWSMALLAQMAPGDGEAVRALDALEQLAFNALPGSLSDDLWSHPYLQFANSFQAMAGEQDHIWASDGPDAAMYGLAPNYECCTANFHQGYPKLITHLFFAEEGALVSAIWAPSMLHIPSVGGGADVELQTSYPFGLTAEYVIKNPAAFKLRVRLPAFLREVAGPHEGLATVRVWLEGHEQIVELADGFLEYEIPPWPLPEPRVALRLEWAAPPKVRRAAAAEQGASVFVGPLLMALDLGEQRHLVKKYEFEAADWNTSATQAWQYGLITSAEGTFGPVVRRAPGALPHRHSATGCPLTVNATLARLTPQGWPTLHGSPGPLPRPGAAGAGQERRLLLPYACSSIRIAAFPESASDIETLSV